MAKRMIVFLSICLLQKVNSPAGMAVAEAVAVVGVARVVSDGAVEKEEAPRSSSSRRV